MAKYSLLKDLQQQYNQAKRDGDPLKSASWGYEEGCLMPFESINEILTHIRNQNNALKAFVDSIDHSFAVMYGLETQLKEAKAILKTKL